MPVCPPGEETVINIPNKLRRVKEDIKAEKKKEKAYTVGCVRR